MIRLLDVNVLIALTWPNHVHHDAARSWFTEVRNTGWATCPLTEAGFVRISCNPSAVKQARNTRRRHPSFGRADATGIAFLFGHGSFHPRSAAGNSQENSRVSPDFRRRAPGLGHSIRWPVGHLRFGLCRSLGSGRSKFSSNYSGMSCRQPIERTSICGFQPDTARDRGAGEPPRPG